MTAPGRKPAVKKTPKLPPPLSALRRRAEAKLAKQHTAAAPVRAAADARRLVSELQVHQVELEMQNAELLRTRLEVEAALVRYTELYDFAPVGYFSVDQQGRIIEVNLTGATMLGVVRSQLRQKRLKDFVAPPSRPAIEDFLATVFKTPGKHGCEALLQPAAGAAFWTDIQAAAAASPAGERKLCRLAVSDIAALKRGADAQRRVESLAAAVQSANQEIARRRAAEATLRESERAQRGLLAQSFELHTQLRELTHQLLRAQEEERKKISRQLHDEIAQILAGISVELATLKETAATDPRGLRQRIGKTRRLVEESIRIVHDFARDLRPAMLDDLGLVPTLRAYIKELATRNGLRVTFSAYAGVESLGSAKHTVLYRVAQEALTNVVRHSNSKTASVRILQAGDAVRLEVHDDGTAFAPERVLAAQQGGRLGLVGMRERIEMVGGRFAIASAPGQGTTVTADIPVAAARNAAGE
jgi:PAS domain S-box-containing protein